MSLVLMSEQTDKLMKAFVKMQSQIEAVGKDAKGFGYKYATLQNVVENTREVLKDNGLAVSQWPHNDGLNSVGVSTLIVHESGQWMQKPFVMPLISGKSMNDAQAAGAVITYARRYAYAAALGIVIDEDTDATEKQPYNRPSQKPAPKTNGASVQVITEQQMKLLRVVLSKAYGDDADAKKEELVASITDGSSKSAKDLTKAQASKLIEGIKDKHGID